MAEVKGKFPINIHYLPIPKRIHYLLAHIYFRSNKDGCFETNLSISLIFGISESSIEKDLKQLLDLDAIEIENPGSPGKCIKPTERVYSFLDENTQSIMDRTTAKKVFGDRKNLRPDTVKDYDQHRKGLRPDTVKDYDHNSNRKETYNKNSLKGERDFSNKIQITPSDSHSFVEALNQSNLLEAFTDKVKADPETKNLKPETIIKHFGEKNTGHTYTSSIELLDRFDGYMTRKLYKNINLPASVPSVVRAGRLI